MSFRSLLIHRVTIFNPLLTSDGPVVVDRYGDEEKKWDDGTVAWARIQQQSADENLVDRDSSQLRYLVFLLPTAVISGLSVIEWEGHRMSVVGDVSEVYDGRRLHHLECEAEEVEG